MGRPRSLDRVLLVLLAVWALCFALSLRSRPALIPSLGVWADEAGRYPIVVHKAPWADDRIALGDRLIRLGSADLRGVGPLGFYARFQIEARYGEPVPVLYERDGRRGDGMGPPPRLAVAVNPVLPLSFVLAALFLSLRAPSTPLTCSVSRAFLIFAIYQSSLFFGGIALNYVSLAVVTVGASLAHPLGLRAVLLFLRGGVRASRWARLGPWAFTVMGPLAMSGLAGFPLPLRGGGRLSQLANLVYGVTMIVLIARAYRRSDVVLRRQTRWLALGFYGAMTPTVVILAIVLLDKLVTGEVLRTYPLVGLPYWFAILIPVSFVFAIARYNLFDVDRLISAAASYNVVIVALVGAGLVLVPRLAAAASALVGVDPGTGQVALALALAALVVPAHQRLRPRIDRAFFRERYALDRGIAELLPELAACSDARELARRAGVALHRLFRPEACVVYAAVDESFVPVFVEGRAVPPAFAASSPLVGTLAEHRGPLALSDAGRRPDAASLGAFDRAALQTLEAEVVVPVRRENLAAFLCLGPKRSGDVYTPTDLSHLAAVAETVSGQLRRFDREETARQARQMQEALRRYVPGAVAEALDGGRDLESAEREVTVLFVDLRGYTGFAERRAAEEIFATLNAYTEQVSGVVRARGGSVVEFHGDGLMAVFGAPRPMERKERAAVEAAREVLEALSGKLEVGVGIATGPDFVGSIRAVDRMIWTAVGNTTNLAARLQALTRELGAAIAIDAPTHAAAGYVCADFARHPEVRIRGRSEPCEVWALALPAHRDALPSEAGRIPA